MNVINDFYLELMAKCQTAAPNYKRFEWYANQLESIDNPDDYALFYDTIFMELMPIEWETLGRKKQTAPVTFMLYLCTAAVHGTGSDESTNTRNEGLNHLEVCQDLFKALQGYGVYAKGIGTISRVGTNFTQSYPGLVVDVLTFKTRLTDGGAQPEMQIIDPDLEITLT